MYSVSHTDNPPTGSVSQNLHLKCDSMYSGAEGEVHSDKLLDTTKTTESLAVLLWFSPIKPENMAWDKNTHLCDPKGHTKLHKHNTRKTVSSEADGAWKRDSLSYCFISVKWVIPNLTSANIHEKSRMQIAIFLLSMHTAAHCTYLHIPVHCLGFSWSR